MVRRLGGHRRDRRLPHRRRHRAGLLQRLLRHRHPRPVPRRRHRSAARGADPYGRPRAERPGLIPDDPGVTRRHP
ncbi:hypothetical protein SGPA1_21482 [Streptomyces misionensis JCM 4497]